MYTTIIPAIKTILEGVTAVQDVYPYPLAGNPKAYPSVVFVPDDLSNAYDTNQTNRKDLRFRMWVVVNLSGTDEETAFTSILPNVVDDIIAAFDENWNGGTLNGHRVWHTLESGFWGLSEEQKSLQAFAELVLTVRLSTDA